MDVENTLAKNTQTSENNLYTDASCKRLFANKEILARLLKGCVQEFADCDVNDIADKYIEGTPEIGKIPVDPDTANLIRGIATEDSSPAEGKITFDIRFMATIPNSEQSEDSKESMHLNKKVRNLLSLIMRKLKRYIQFGFALIPRKTAEIQLLSILLQKKILQVTLRKS